MLNWCLLTLFWLRVLKPGTLIGEFWSKQSIYLYQIPLHSHFYCCFFSHLKLILFFGLSIQKFTRISERVCHSMRLVILVECYMQQISKGFIQVWAPLDKPVLNISLTLLLYLKHTADNCNIYRVCVEVI